VPHFRRLDLDDDGRITLTDLQSLQVPLQLSVRVGGIFAALDKDQDGGIDADEFLNSMQKARK
jgi:Ca2+-binding EF-hand superfamily protein